MYFTYLRLGANGRLGNQLFQVASTIGTAARNGCFFRFLNSWAVRPLLKNELPKITMEEIQQSQFITLQEGKNGFKKINLSTDYIFNPAIKNMNGYFQSEKYFNFVDHSIRHYFEPTDEIVEYIKNKYKFIIEDDYTALHARRADYVTLQTEHPWKPHPPTTKEYFDKAIEEIGAKKLCVFSDGIDWCKEALKDYDCYFVEERGHESFEENHRDHPDFMKLSEQTLREDFVEMMLMSMCKNNIISNSSFSWWGAWLNKDRDKQVVAPRKWFSEMQEKNECEDPVNYIHDIIPTDWKIL
jgi:hypothetical protein